MDYLLFNEGIVCMYISPLINSPFLMVVSQTPGPILYEYPGIEFDAPLARRYKSGDTVKLLNQSYVKTHLSSENKSKTNNKKLTTNPPTNQPIPQSQGH